MWIPWVKKSPARTHTKSPYTTTISSNHNPPPPQSPIHHHHSPSLKDIDTLLHHPPPFSPLHKHSLSSKDIPIPFSPARSPAHLSISFKDIQSLFHDDPAQTQTHSQSHTPTRKPSVFHRVRTWANPNPHPSPTRHSHPPPDAQNRVVIYFTSLRVVRRTYEDCKAVRSIMKGYRVKLDERDLAMDGSFVEELQRIIPHGKRELNLNLNLPRVYINGKYVGGVEEIRRLHENGELKKMIQGLPLADGGGVCKMCGGFRFIVCEWCDGSHRVFIDEFGFKSCSVCNVNGLIQCRFCTTVVF